MWKPKVFVGSSSEARGVAEQFCKTLQPVANMIPWWASPEFEPMHTALDGLFLASNIYDFGLFVMTPDDKIESRGEKKASARDNVLFEIGLFLGRLEADRVFVFVQEGTKKQAVKMPSDLAGLIIPRFSNFDKYNLIASVEAAASEYRKLIQHLGPRMGKLKLAKSWGFDAGSSVFEMTLNAAKIKKNLSTLREGRLVIVARKFDPNIAPEEDLDIAIGTARKIPRLGSEDLVLSADGSKAFKDLGASDRIDAYLLFVPDRFDLAKVKSISQMMEHGCDLFDRYGNTVGTIPRRRKPKTTRKPRKGRS